MSNCSGMVFMVEEKLNISQYTLTASVSDGTHVRIPLICKKVTYISQRGI